MFPVSFPPDHPCSRERGIVLPTLQDPEFAPHPAVTCSTPEAGVSQCHGGDCTCDLMPLALPCRVPQHRMKLRGGGQVVLGALAGAPFISHMEIDTHALIRRNYVTLKHLERQIPWSLASTCGDPRFLPLPGAAAALPAARRGVGGLLASSHRPGVPREVGGGVSRSGQIHAPPTSIATHSL